MMNSPVSAVVPSGSGILNELWRSGPEAARSDFWTWLETPTRLGLQSGEIAPVFPAWAVGAMVISMVALGLAWAEASKAKGRNVPGMRVRRDLRVAAGSMAVCAAVVTAMGWTKRTHVLGESMVTLSPGLFVLAASVLLAVLLARKLGRVDPGACVACGYPLPGPASRCPECGVQDEPDGSALSRPSLFPPWFRVLTRWGTALALAVALLHVLSAMMPMPSLLKPTSVVAGTNTGAAGPAGGLRFLSWRTARVVASPWFTLEWPEGFRVAIVHRQQDLAGYACLGFSGDETRVGRMESSFVKPPEGWVEVSPASVRELLAEAGLGTTPEDDAVIATMLLQMDANFKLGGNGTPPPATTQGRSVLWTPDAGRLEPTRFSVLALMTVSMLVGGGWLARGRARE